MHEVLMLQEFLGGKEKNKWIEGDLLHIYVRKGVHPNHKKEIVKTLDLANVACLDKGKGIFTRFIGEVEQISPLPIFVESVLNDRLGDFLLKRGYFLIPNTKPPCFFYNLDTYFQNKP